MTDFFGIGNALRAQANIYRQTARASGRTLAMVESLKDGDRVWFVDDREAKRVDRMCAERGIKIEALVCSPRNPAKAYQRGTAQGKVLFDHSWVEQFYLDALEHADKQLSAWQDETGHADGMGEAHIETRCQARERQRWEPFLSDRDR